MNIREVLDRLDEINRRDLLKSAGAAAVGGMISKSADAEWKIDIDRGLTINKSKENPEVILVVDINGKTEPSLGKSIMITSVPVMSIYKLKFPRYHGCTVQIGNLRFRARGLFTNSTEQDKFGRPTSLFVLASKKINLNSNLLDIFINQPASNTQENDIKITFDDFEEIYTFSDDRSKKKKIREVREILDEINRRDLLKSAGAAVASAVIPTDARSNSMLIEPFYKGMPINEVKKDLKQFLDMESSGARGSAKILGITGVAKIGSIKLEKPTNILEIPGFSYFEFDNSNMLVAIHIYAKLPRRGFFDNQATGFVKDRAIFNESCMKLFEKIQSIGIVGMSISNKPSLEAYENMGGSGMEIIGSSMPFTKGNVMAVGLRSYMGHVLGEVIVTIDK